MCLKLSIFKMAAQYDGGINLTINNSQLAVAVFILRALNVLIYQKQQE